MPKAATQPLAVPSRKAPGKPTVPIIHPRPPPPVPASAVTKQPARVTRLAVSHLEVEEEVAGDAGEWDFDEFEETETPQQPVSAQNSMPLQTAVAATTQAAAARPIPPPAINPPPKQKLQKDTGWDFDDDAASVELMTTTTTTAATTAKKQIEIIHDMQQPANPLEPSEPEGGENSGWDFDDVDDMPSSPVVGGGVGDLLEPNRIAGDAKKPPAVTKLTPDDDIGNGNEGTGWDFDDFDDNF